MPAPSDPTFRKPLEEGDLRAAKDDAVKALSEQARAFGAEPHGRAIEEFVAPILEKVNRDHDELLLKGIDPNSTPARGPREREDVEVGSTELGSYDPVTGAFTPNEAGRKALARRASARPATLEEKAIALVAKRTKNDPDFAALRSAWATLQVSAVEPARHRFNRNVLLHQILETYIKKHGDPRAEVMRLEQGGAHGG